MDLYEALLSRRTIYAFEDRPVPGEALLRALEAARWAPNHKLTEPWRFSVLGAETRAAPLDHDGLVLGGWFRIEAGSLEAASALAAQAPSVARGGAAELRTHFPAPPMTPGSAPMAAN